MTTEEKINFLKANIEPLFDQIYGNGFRASAYLTDGTYIPCVRFRNPELITQLAIKRFEQEKKGISIFKSSSKNRYKEIVELFVTNGNNLNENANKSIKQTRQFLVLQCQMDRLNLSVNWSRKEEK